MTLADLVSRGGGATLAVVLALAQSAPASLAPLRTTVTPFTATADGQSFLFVTQGQEAASLQFTVVTNWMAEVKK